MFVDIFELTMQQLFCVKFIFGSTVIPNTADEIIEAVRHQIFKIIIIILANALFSLKYQPDSSITYKYATTVTLVVYSFLLRGLPVKRDLIFSV